MCCTEHLHLISNATDVCSDCSGSKSNLMHWQDATDLWKNKGLVLCSGSKTMQKFKKHICFLLLRILYFIYLASKLFKGTCFTRNPSFGVFGRAIVPLLWMQKVKEDELV